MPRQSLATRLVNAYRDCTAPKEGKAAADPADRWAKIRESFEGEEELTRVESLVGPMPDVDLDDVPRDAAVKYACRDADATLRVFRKLDPLIDAHGLRDVYRMDMAVIPFVDRMQMRGMLVDKAHFASLAGHLTTLMELKCDEISRVAGLGPDQRINPNSPDQTAALLFDRLGLPCKKKTRTGKDSTNDKVLESLRRAHPVVGLICDYRELAKMRDSFCVSLPLAVGEDGRIHPNFRVTRVSTGRLSCTEPNLLAIPVRSEMGKQIREGFPAAPDCVLGSWDLDQIEMREMAYQSGDPVLIDLFQRGVDVHRATGAWTFGKRPEDVTFMERYASKRIGFGVITGITEMGLLDQMEMAGAEGWDETRCKQAIAAFFDMYKYVRPYMDACRSEARATGLVRDRWGRIRYLPGVHSDIPYIREEALRQTHSFKISASAQGILKHAMKAIWDWLLEERLLGRVEPLLQIHDELVFEVADDPDLREYVDSGIIHYLCETTGLGPIPIRAKGSYGPTWGQLKD